MWKEGDQRSITKQFVENDVISFAKITGDNNPIHIDEEYASKTRFQRRLVHGILVSGLISAVLGMHIPGPGSIYISQSLNFKAPVFIGDRITTTATILAIRVDKPIATLETICRNQDNTIVVEGKAVLLLPKE